MPSTPATIFSTCAEVGEIGRHEFLVGRQIVRLADVAPADVAYRPGSSLRMRVPMPPAAPVTRIFSIMPLVIAVVSGGNAT